MADKKEGLGGKISNTTFSIFKGVGKIVVTPFKLIGKVGYGLTSLIAGKENADKIKSTVGSWGTKIKADIQTAPATSKLAALKSEMVAMLMGMLEKLKGVVDKSNKDVAEAKREQAKLPVEKRSTEKVQAATTSIMSKKKAEEVVAKKGKANDIGKTIAAASPAKTDALSGPGVATKNLSLGKSL